MFRQIYVAIIGFISGRMSELNIFSLVRLTRSDGAGVIGPSKILL